MYNDYFGENDQLQSFSSKQIYNKCRQQHYLLLFLILILLIIFSVHLYSNHLMVARGLLVEKSAVVHSEFKVNPNTASWEIISLLPGIGPTKAQAIVHYRDEYIAASNKDHNNNDGLKSCFSNPSDLEKVSGIGPKTVELIKNNLTFTY